MKKMIGGGALSSSSCKIILDDFPAVILRSGEMVPCVPRKTFHILKFLRVDSVGSGRIRKPTPLRSSSIEVNIDEDADTEAVEKSAPGRRTVRVRFQLRKECVFGEHFFILGDHPLFGGGLWDPANALPLHWSDGHVWTLDLDLPVGSLVEFKFILKAKTGEILWQPGPNRAVKAWETNKTIRLCEDWENADLQMMMEEDFVPLNQQSSIVILDMPIPAENVTHPKPSVTLLTSASSNGAAEEVELLATVQQISSVVALENEGYVSDESDENSSSNGAQTALDEKVTEEAMFAEEESPVLVPGLFPPADLESEEVSGPITHVVVGAINEGKTETFPEVDKKQETTREINEKGKVEAVPVFEKPEQEVVKDEENGHYNAAEEEVQQQWIETEALGTPHVLLQKDIHWGRRKLYKLLSNFGLF